MKRIIVEVDDDNEAEWAVLAIGEEFGFRATLEEETDA